MRYESAGPWSRHPLACLLVFLLTACSNPAADDGGTPDPAERDAFRHGSSSQTTLQQMVVVSDSMFDLDPTLDPSMSAMANAAAIQRDTMANLGSCGSAMVAGTTVTVSFGTGCTLHNGAVVSGSAALAVSGGQGQPLVVTATFTNLTVNGTAVNGSATFTTNNGTTFTVMASLMSGGNSINANLTVTGSTGAFTVSGTAQATNAGTTSMLTCTNLHVTRGQCYPDGGSLTVTRGAIAMTLTFNAMTPATGQVTVMQGRRSYPMTLPAYGNCPPGARDS